MARTTRRFSLALLLVVALPPLSPCQDSARVIILSPRVGPVITAADRERFSIFGAINNFQRAIVYQRPDTTFFVRFLCREGIDSIAEKRVDYSLQGLLSMAEKINHYEELKAGTYQMGTDPARLQYAVGNEPMLVKAMQMRQTTKASAFADDVLPFNGLLPVEIPAGYPRFAIRIGLSSTPCDLSGLSDLVNAVENSFRNLGYPVGSYSPGVSLGPSAWVSLALFPDAPAMIALEGGTSIGNTGASFTLGSISILWYPLTSESGPVLPFVGGGADAIRISLDREVACGDRVSDVDQNGGYYALDKIEFKGNNRAWGWHATGGLEIPFTDSRTTSVCVNATYYSKRGNPIGAASSAGAAPLLQRDLTTGNFMFGAYLLIFL